jgi:hypothetical protein
MSTPDATLPLAALLYAAALSPPSPAATAASFARISASRPPAARVAAFAGGDQHTTILSSCQTHLLSLLDTRAALPLRATCREARAAVARHPFCDLGTIIQGHLGPTLQPTAPAGLRGAWRACFPCARGANVQRVARLAAMPTAAQQFRRRAPLRDADLAHLAGLHTLVMSGCEEVTDAGFAHLRGVRALDMSHCSQRAISDAAFAHLQGLQSLDMSLCSQDTLSDAAFAHLRGIRTLDISGCTQSTITSAAFEPLVGLQHLSMAWCSQPGLGDAAFFHLRRGLRTLDVSFCTQPTLTDAAFRHLEGLEELRVCGCTQATLTEDALKPLAGSLRSLDASFSALASDAAVENLACLQSLVRLNHVRFARVGGVGMGGGAHCAAFTAHAPQHSHTRAHTSHPLHNPSLPRSTMLPRSRH